MFSWKQVGRQKGETSAMARVFVGGFRRNFELVHFRGSYLEVELDDGRPEDRLLGAIGCGGELRLHLQITKSPIHY